jgi:hypothetical protein
LKEKYDIAQNDKMMDNPGGISAHDLASMIASAYPV